LSRWRGDFFDFLRNLSLIYCRLIADGNEALKPTAILDRLNTVIKENRKPSLTIRPIAKNTQKLFDLATEFWSEQLVVSSFGAKKV